MILDCIILSVKDLFYFFNLCYLLNAKLTLKKFTLKIIELQSIYLKSYSLIYYNINECDKI